MVLDFSDIPVLLGREPLACHSSVAAMAQVSIAYWVCMHFTNALGKFYNEDLCAFKSDTFIVGTVEVSRPSQLEPV